MKLARAAQAPRVLTAAEAQAILDVCEHLRDRFLFAAGATPGSSCRAFGV